MAYVVVFRGDQLITRRALDDDGALVFGRAPECDVVLPDIKVSRRHCRLAPGPHGWAVTDLGSSNGTYVGGLEVSTIPLGDGDEIRVGTCAIRFLEGSIQKERPSDPTHPLAGLTPIPTGVDPTESSARSLDPALPRPMPKAWPGEATPDDPSSAASTGLSFSKIPAPPARRNKE